MTSRTCIVCGTKLFTDENLSACAHGLRCEICTTQNAECVACVKIEEFGISQAFEPRVYPDGTTTTDRANTMLEMVTAAELVPNSPERLAMIARVMDGHTSLPLGASIPGTKAPQGYWPLRELLLRKIAQGRFMNHRNTVAHAGELFAQIVSAHRG